MDELAYYASVWLAGAICGASRCIRNGQFRSVWHCSSVAVVSGFSSFAVICLAPTKFGDVGFDHMFYLGIACVVGLAGKEQTDIISLIWKKLIPGAEKKK